VGKLVVLKLGDGSFDVGFPVTLQVGDDGERPLLQITGKLPPATEIPQCYSAWATAYRRLGVPYRLEAKVGLGKNVSKMEDCYNAAQVLSDRLNGWLHFESFRSVREKLLEQLMPSDEIRVIVQTEDIRLRRLPWHLWDFCDRYPNAEIALSAPNYEHVQLASSPTAKVRILAILGNSAGINTAADRLLLEQLPDAEISFLVEPQRQELTEKLWKQDWDILFFAGHSASEAISKQSNGNEEETGRIYINQTDSLTIEQLKYAVKRSVERGLKIAVFNSCDGLGLARNLADLQIPQIIVMREPIPDRVAQEFLKYFLEAFSRGERFYLAVREARERLQGLEAEFPCASWLPLICQNPAEVPPTWLSLCGKTNRNHTKSTANWQDTQILVGSSHPRSVLLPSEQQVAKTPSRSFVYRTDRLALIIKLGITTLFSGGLVYAYLQSQSPGGTSLSPTRLGTTPNIVTTDSSGSLKSKPNAGATPSSFNSKPKLNSKTLNPSPNPESKPNSGATPSSSSFESKLNSKTLNPSPNSESKSNSSATPSSSNSKPKANSRTIPSSSNSKPESYILKTDPSSTFEPSTNSDSTDPSSTFEPKHNPATPSTSSSSELKHNSATPSASSSPELKPDSATLSPSSSPELKHNSATPSPSSSPELKPDSATPSPSSSSELKPDSATPSPSSSSELKHNSATPSPSSSPELKPDSATPSPSSSPELKPDSATPSPSSNNSGKLTGI